MNERPNEAVPQGSAPSLGSPSPGALRRGEILIDRGYPRLRAWYPPLYAFGQALLVGFHESTMAVKVALWLGLLLASLSAVVWYVKHRGVEPNLRHQPAVRRSEAAGLLFGLLVVGIAAFLVAPFVWWLGVAVFFVGGTVLIARFEGNTIVTPRD